MALAGLALAVGWLLLLAAPAFAAGPPFPAPVEGQRVYDQAGIWSDGAAAEAERIIASIEARTGTEVVVYSQHVAYGTDQAAADQQAAALGTQWGVGRAGFDDGAVMLFDIDPSGIHGTVAIVSGSGFRNTYLSDAQSTRIFEQQMLSHLQESPPDFDGAMLAGVRAIDTAATPEGRAALERARIFDAVLGLLIAPLLGLGLIAWAVFHWLRYGRDPVYLDDPSILMPAPPDQLTAASGALVYDGSSSRRTLTTALLDLASRGALAFEERPDDKQKLAIVTSPTAPEDPVEATRQRLADRRPLSDAERYVASTLHAMGVAEGDVIEGSTLLEFGKRVDGFDDKLEAYAVEQGWFKDPPSSVRRRWLGLALLEGLGAAGAFLVGVNAPISGLVVVGVAVGIAALATAGIATVMPARTMSGATIRAMLAAYRRTLQKTMEQARSMDQVVAGANLAWIETPDQAFVWSVALGLKDEVDEVMRRSVSDVREGRAQPAMTWLPIWYGPMGSGGQGGWDGGTPGGGGSIFSGSAVPNVAGMMAVLGTVGNTPSSAGGGAGGFGGGGGFSGGGGGSF